VLDDPRNCNVTEPAAPCDTHGAAPRCRKCGTEHPAGSNQCSRCGSFLPGSAMRLSHGLRRYHEKGEGTLPADLQVSIDEFRAALIGDQGGLDQLTAVRAGLCRMLVDAEVGRLLLISEVVKRGIDSKPGRAAYDRLLATMDRWQRIAMTLGLNRHTKPASFKSFVDGQ